MPVSHKGELWRRVFVVLLALTVGSYLWYQGREFPHGGSPIGLIYGIVGLSLIALLLYFGIRKRSYRSRVGTLEGWLQAHIYLGILCFVILLCHTGGRFNDRVAVATMVVVGIVVFSGMFGAILYGTVPKMLTEVESNLTAQEISDQLNQLAKSMARIASGKSAPFQRIYNSLINESRPGFLAGWRILFSGIGARKRRKTGEWAGQIALVGKPEQDDLRQLLVVSRQRKELLYRLIFQQRYKNILDAWLYLHIPFSIALVVLAIAHVVAVFYYGKVQFH